jgi:hypothetical protein
MAVVTGHGAVREILEIAGLTRLITVVNRLEEAAIVLGITRSSPRRHAWLAIVAGLAVATAGTLEGLHRSGFALAPWATGLELAGLSLGAGTAIAVAVRATGLLRRIAIALTAIAVAVAIAASDSRGWFGKPQPRDPRPAPTGAAATTRP